MEHLTPNELERAAQLLREGSLVAFPTETVYGLGARIFDKEAVASIFRAKGRPADNPLIAHLSSLEQINRIAIEVPTRFYSLAEAFFPGPLTLVLKRHPSVPSIVSGGRDSIALRMPAHPCALSLIALVQEPVVAPSANLSGKPSATQAAHVCEDFEGKIAAVVDGGSTEIGIESTVLSLISETPLLLRPGAVTQEEIERVLGAPVTLPAARSEDLLLSPGMKYRHYAPQTPLKLFFSLAEAEVYLFQSRAKRRMALSRDPLKGCDHYTFTSKELYAYLRLADHLNYEEIVVLCDAEVQREKGLMNRLLRAAEMPH